jgi:hypothetical protein
VLLVEMWVIDLIMRAGTWSRISEMKLGRWLVVSVTLNVHSRLKCQPPINS